MTQNWEGSLLPGGTALPPHGPDDAVLAAMVVSLLLVWLLATQAWS